MVVSAAAEAPQRAILSALVAFYSPPNVRGDASLQWPHDGRETHEHVRGP